VIVWRTSPIDPTCNDPAWNQHREQFCVLFVRGNPDRVGFRRGAPSCRATTRYRYGLIASTFRERHRTADQREFRPPSDCWC
jgi:hypothetical protein